MSENTGAGLGDPYWYEWSVGQGYIVDMLAADSRILSVTLQKTGDKGLDDVVVRFTGGDARFVQVKHTRVGATLTFGDLVTADDDDDHPSLPLLRYVAEAWQKEADRNAGACEAVLYTNREAGRRRSSTRAGPSSILRPPLGDFLTNLEAQLAQAKTLDDVKVPAEWQEAWDKEWLPQLDALGTDERKLRFMKCFRIQASEEGLAEIGEALVSKLEALFSIDRSAALRLRSYLDSALRDWATSLRGSEEAVTREVAYEKICLIDDVLVGEHALAPPAPFFRTRVPVGDGVETLLRQRAEPVVFVVGEPGSGKTALISDLANRRDPVIDVRFHAYRPITPENRLLPADAGRTTTPRALWSDLLIQIRDLARGRLSALNVPVHAGSLSVEQLRHHVLRVANELGDQEGRAFVIAVDGIDHAARAGLSAESFLASLVPPDSVPEHVVILVGGQPPEGYPTYPVWLRVSTQGVRRVDLPRLTLEDTRELVDARLSLATESERENAARDVWHRCAGHTLSTVFAIEEAMLVGDEFTNLVTLLDQRQIASGIEAYYQTIWEAATRGLSVTAGTQVAACLCLMPTRATAAALRSTLGAIGGRVVEYADVLRKLRPLVVEDQDGFRLFHNDVRVFLLRVVQGEPVLYRDCASQIADHLMTGSDVLARHEAAQDLFRIAGRHRELAALFTPRYVLEGHAVGRSLDAMSDQGAVAAEALGEMDADWDLAHIVATGLRTLEQLRTSLQWRSADEEAPKAGRVVSTRPAERRVLPQPRWNPEVVGAALDDIVELSALGDQARATAAFNRWFAGLAPENVAAACGLVSADERDHPNLEKLVRLIATLGKASVATGVLLPTSGGSDYAEAAFSRGLLEALIQCEDGTAFAAALERVRGFYYQDVQKLLTKLVEARAWPRCVLLLRVMTPGNNATWAFRLQGAAVAALTGDNSLRERWVTPVLTDRAASLQGASSYGDGLGAEVQPLVTMAWMALLLGLEEPSRDASAIREEIEIPYRGRQRDERQDAAVSQLLHAAAVLGSFAYTTRECRNRAVHVGPDVVARTINVLLTAPERERYRLPHLFPTIATAIVHGLIDCALRDQDVTEAIRQVLVAQLARRQWLGPHVEAVWRALAALGHSAELVAYADYWMGSDGVAWKEAPADRHNMVNRLTDLLGEIGQGARAAAARARLEWADIGYTGHKEYALHEPLEWFEGLARLNPSTWQDEGLRLFALSREASRTGDNRFAWQVEDAVLTAACIGGPDSVARLALAPNGALRPGDRAMVSGLIGLAKEQSLHRADVLATWAFCIGQLSWQIEGDRGRLADVREALLTAGQNDGAHNLAEEMAAAAPAEFACERSAEDQAAAASRDESWLVGLPVTQAMQRACTRSEWGDIAWVLARVASAHPLDTSSAVALAWAALSARPERVWFYDGAGPAYEAIFPMLTPFQRWEAVQREVTSQIDRVPEYRTNRLAANLGDLCRLAAAVEGRGALERGLRRTLDMQELWVSGGGNLPPLERIPLQEAARASSWSQLFLPLLVNLVNFDEQAYVQAALRGLYQLLLLEPSLYGTAVAAVDAGGPEVVGRFLLMAEALAVQPGAAVLRDWLVGKMGSSRLDVALAAWSALRVARRALGEPDPVWEQAEGSPRLIVPAGPPPLIPPPKRMGLLSSVARASSSVLERLEMAVDGDVDDLRAEFSASLRRAAPSVRPLRTRIQLRDMVTDRAAEAELDRLFTILRVREREGRFKDASVLRLAQALSAFADPFVFLRTPPPAVATTWPIEDELDKLIVSNRVVLEKMLADALSVDLSPSVRLIAGVLHTYSTKWDAKVIIEHVTSRNVGPREDRRPSILNGRASLALESQPLLITHPGAAEQEWLTLRVGGVLPFVDATLELFPGRSWTERLHWQADRADPMTWRRDGQRVAWLERLSGPVRRLYPGDFVYRQPTLARWVCLATEWDRMAGMLSPPRRCVESQLGRLKEE